MTIAVGVDGGQSTIRVATSAGDVRRAPGVRHLESAPDEALDVIVEQLRGEHGEIDVLVAGITTVPADKPRRYRFAKALRERTGANQVWLAGDEVTTHAGAWWGGAGVVLAVGTGVACLGVNGTTGTVRRVDGAGYLVGDEGGAFWIGRHGVRAAIADHDGRGRPTALRAEVERCFGPLDDAATALHTRPDGVDAIAQFAPVVIDAAAAGDPAASGIVDDAITRLVTTARAALDHAGATAGLALDGRLAGAHTPLGAQLRQRLAAELSDRQVTSVPGASLDGALRGAIEGVPAVYRPQFTVCERPMEER